MHTGKLKVENPCPFLLERMKKDGENYFCGSCRKTIVDFRGKTEEEIKCAINKETCGIFTIDQLPGQQKKHWLRRACFWGLTVLSFLGYSVRPLSAQTTTKAEKNTEVVYKKKNTKKEADRIHKATVKEKEKNTRKKKAHRRKKQFRVIGTPSF